MSYWICLIAFICLVIALIALLIRDIHAAAALAQQELDAMGEQISAFVTAMDARDVVLAESIVRADSFNVVSYWYREFARGRLAQLHVDIEYEKHKK